MGSSNAPIDELLAWEKEIKVKEKSMFQKKEQKVNFLSFFQKTHFSFFRNLYFLNQENNKLF